MAYSDCSGVHGRSAPFPHTEPLTHVPKRPLIVVCCHAIFVGKSLSASTQNCDESDPFQEGNWLLKPFQQSCNDPHKPKTGEHSTFISHINHAVKVARRFHEAGAEPAIVFSGGQTERSHTSISEARGYLTVYETLHRQAPFTVLLEEKATDSFQNVLFSILRIYRESGEWPDHLSIVTHAFKAHRFVGLHLKALKWPETSVQLEGIDPDFRADERRAVEEAERRCCEDWQRDLYGVRPPLSTKRVDRGWRQEHLLGLNDRSANASIQKLLHWNGGDDPSSVLPVDLPWEGRLRPILMD